MNAISTAAPFSIVSDSPSSSSGISRSRGRRLLPHVVFGSVALLLGTAPVHREGSAAPTAVRPAPIQVANDLTERRAYQKASALDRGIARLFDFLGYAQDWDGSGASAPDHDAIHRAIAYLCNLEAWHPVPLTTVGTDGSAILEFDEGGVFSSITFLPQGGIELYFKASGEETSRFLSDRAGSHDLNAFLTSTMNLPAIA